MTRRGLSFLEVILGAAVLAMSGVVVLELVRSNTVNLQITEVEALARGLGADVLERYARRSSFITPLVKSEADLKTPRLWKDVLEDPSLKYGFPQEKLASLLDQYDVRFIVEMAPFPHASLGPKPKMRSVQVTVQWNDPNARAAGDTRSVMYGCLVDW